MPERRSAGAAAAAASQRADLAAGLFDPIVAVVEGDPRQDFGQDALFSAEAELVAKAVQARRQQFTAGRVFARRALAKLGRRPEAINADERRAPRWPEGVVGSISHTDSWCVAAVAERADLWGLGVDIEKATPLKPALWHLVCRPDEQERLAGIGELGDWLKLLFSAKECFYKAQYPVTGAFLEFRDVTTRFEPDCVTPAAESGRFVISLDKSAPPLAFGSEMTGRFVRRGGHWATALTLVEP